jgi:hypothetical protein
MDMNIYELIRGRRHYLPEGRLKDYMYQLLKSMDHMHRNGIFHRDIKPENILVLDDELKLADFGSCRGIYSKQPYTEYISTRWCAPRHRIGTAPHGHCRGDAEAMQRRCRGDAEAMQRRCRGDAEAMQRRCRGDAEAMQRRCRGDAEAMQRRCRGDAEAMQWRCRGDAEALQRRCRGDAAAQRRCRGAAEALQRRCTAYTLHPPQCICTACICTCIRIRYTARARSHTP